MRRSNLSLFLAPKLIASSPCIGGLSGMRSRKPAIIPEERILRAILFVRGQKVMLDSTLAELYGVETRAIMQAVKRNPERFPEDFLLQLHPSRAG